MKQKIYKKLNTQSKKTLNTKNLSKNITKHPQNFCRKVRTNKIKFNTMNKHELRNVKRNQSSKYITSSKEKEAQNEIDHINMLENELTKFRNEIELKFKESIINKNYIFPRKEAVESEDDITSYKRTIVLIHS